MSEINDIINQIKVAASDVVGKDVAELRGFTESQIKALAQQTELVGKGILSGDITDETREFLLDGLEDMALNLAKTLRGILMVTIEKVWNAIVKVIYDAINRIAGVNLVAP